MKRAMRDQQTMKRPGIHRLSLALGLSAAIFLPGRLLAQAPPDGNPATSASAGAAPPAVAAWQKRKDGSIIHPHEEHAMPGTRQPPGLYVAMGDSITNGTGVKQNCQAFPTHPVDIEEYCPDGTSYAILVAKALRKAGIAGSFMNVGIGGAHLNQVIAEELPYVPSEATIVTVYMGTNDSRVVQKVTIPIADAVSQFEEEYDKLLAGIHAKAPHARIVLVNFPNQMYLADPKRFGPEITPRFDATSQIEDKFIDDHYPKYPVADVVCNPATYDDAMIYEAGVHPNEAGAAILANSVLTAILAPMPPPQSCKWFDASKAAGPIQRP